MGNFPALTKTWGNVLKMSSAENTAFCYSSEDFTVATDSYNTVAVTLYADNLSGYGANLVLKKDGKVVATIEKSPSPALILSMSRAVPPTRQ